MPTLRLAKLCAVTWAAIGVGMMSTSAASAIGYYNLPGSFCQCFGYGNGAGHHACLVLGPANCEGFCATNEVRLACPPQPPYSCYGYGQQYGRMQQGTWLNEPVLQQPPAQPQFQQPQPGAGMLPTPAAMRPQILR